MDRMSPRPRFELLAFQLLLIAALAINQLVELGPVADMPVRAALDGSGQHLALVLAEGQTRVFDLAEQTLVCELPIDHGQPALSDDGATLVLDQFEELRVIQLPSGVERARIPGEFDALAPSGRWLVVADRAEQRNHYSIVDLSDGSHAKRPLPDGLYPSGFDAADRLIMGRPRSADDDRPLVYRYHPERRSLVQLPLRVEAGALWSVRVLSNRWLLLNPDYGRWRLHALDDGLPRVAERGAQASLLPSHRLAGDQFIEAETLRDATGSYARLPRHPDWFNAYTDRPLRIEAVSADGSTLVAIGGSVSRWQAGAMIYRVEPGRLVMTARLTGARFSGPPSRLPGWLLGCWLGCWLLWTVVVSWRSRARAAGALTLAPLAIYGVAALLLLIHQRTDVRANDFWHLFPSNYLPREASTALWVAHGLPLLVALIWLVRWRLGRKPSHLLWACLLIHAALALGTLRWMVWA